MATKRYRSGRKVIGALENLFLYSRLLGLPPDSPFLQFPQIPSVLVLAPTRELTVQIEAEAQKFSRAANAFIISLYGGTPKGAQVSILLAFYENSVLRTVCSQSNQFDQPLPIRSKSCVLEWTSWWPHLGGATTCLRWVCWT